MQSEFLVTCLLRTAPALVLPLLAANVLAQTPDHLVGITRNAPFLRHLDQPNCALIGQCSDTCVVQCPPFAIPTLPANAFVTGLEVVTSRDELWLIDSQGNLQFFANACPPASIGGCNTGLVPAAGKATTALCVDERRGIVRGLAVDWGKDLLYATDGVITMAVPYTWSAPNVTLLAPFCGPIHTLPLLNLGPNPTGGTGVCDGAAVFDLPLPVAPALAGSVFSSQCLALCFGGGVFGVAQSNCLSWELQGN